MINIVDANPGAVVQVVKVLDGDAGKLPFVGAEFVIELFDDPYAKLKAKDGYGPYSEVYKYWWLMGELELVRHAVPPEASNCEHDFITSWQTGKPWCRKCGHRSEE